MDAGTVKLLQRLLRDQQFGAALVAAPLFWAGLYTLTRPTIDLLWPLNTPAAFVLPALIYPVLEEIVFRGAGQGLAWRTKLANYAIGPLSGPNLLVSAVFTSLHVVLQGGWLAGSVLIPSLIFGYFRDRYNNIAPCIVLHVVYNAGLFLLFKAPG